jgi:hypothetical protein
MCPASTSGRSEKTVFCSESWDWIEGSWSEYPFPLRPKAGSILFMSLDRPSTHVPCRYWWLKRVPVALVFLLAVLGVLRWWWGVKASQALEAEVARLRAAGEPLLPEDFQRPVVVPDEENAALLLKRAADSLDLTREQSTALSDLSRHKVRIREQPEVAAELYELSAEARALVRQARDLSGCDWGFRWQGLNTPPPELYPYNRLTDLLVILSVHLHEHGQPAAAIESLRDCLAYANHLGKHGTLIAAGLTDGSIRSAAETLEMIGPSLLMADPEPSATDDGLTERIRTLIDHLLEEPTREAMISGLRLDRAWAYAVTGMMCEPGGYDLYVSGKFIMVGRPRSFLLRPMYELDGARILRHYSKIVDAFEEDTWPAASARFPDMSSWQNLSLLGRHARILSGLTVSNYLPPSREIFRTLARSRMAAVGLAIWLYEADHGHLPESLDLLVPDYIEAIPRDPLAEGDVPIGYTRDAQRPFLVCGREEDDPVRFFLKPKSTGTSGRAGTTPAD